MQYMWEHRLWGARELATNDGRRVRVIDPGRRNTDAGPDFFNAKVEIDGCLWAGNVEIHYRASDWHRHGHDDDPAYDTVVLHVVAKDDAPVVRANGERIPQMVMECTAEIADRYAALVNSTVELPCRQVIREMTSLDVAEWVQSLIFERLADKSRRVKGLLDRFHGSWEDTCYVTLARTIGFGTNSDAFELLAKSLPLNLLHKHADSLLQLEALFFGQAGLLDRPATDRYQEQLQRLRELFSVTLTGYWSNHYTFGRESQETQTALGRSSVDIVLINTVAPLYYTYAETADDYDWTERAVALLENLKPEHNHVTTMFGNAGMKIDNAMVSQAVIQLRNAYCLPHKCLYCLAGHKMLAAK